MLEWTNERKARLIGSLFHDIGKFQYRAEKTTLPHHVNSERFIREFLGKHKCLKEIIEEAARIARQHHDSNRDYALRMADSSSAEEREDEKVIEARRPLFSLFNYIQNIKKLTQTVQRTTYIRPGALSITDIFPEDFPNNFTEEKLIDLHKPSWYQFLNEIDGIPKELEFRELCNTLLAILEKWTSRISSAGYKVLPDIALYDHLRVTAAYADCISETDNLEKPFLLIEVDIGGIQNFIYRIANISHSEQKGTAKILRGRSFLIILYTEIMSNYILNELNLLNTHLLMNGGGGFTILAPNRKEINDKLITIKKVINKWLFDEFHGDISFVMVWDTFKQDEIINFNNVKRIMLQRITDAKYQKNLEFINDSDFWGPENFADDKIKVCNVCGEYFYVKDNEDSRRCKSCILQQKIGQELPHINTFLLIHNSDGEIFTKEGLLIIPIKKLKQYIVFLIESKGKQNLIDNIRNILIQIPTNASVDLIRLNSLDFIDPVYLSIARSMERSVSYQFRFLGNTAEKDSKGDILSFEELAESSEGFPALGILRMDVDSLGSIFAYGFSDKKLTLSRIASLSRLMVLFFSGYINYLASKHKIYISYSGGDDLFAVGGWTQIIDFAIDVYLDFKRFVSNNPHITISGGISIIKPSFPIRLAATMTGEEENKAKNLDAGKTSEKNALCLFGESNHWEDIINLIHWAKKVVDFIKKQNSNEVSLRSLIRYFKELREESIDPEGKQDPFWLAKAQHKIHYSLKRRAGLGNKEIQNKENNLATLLAPILSDPNLIPRINIPANYILLKTRKK